MPKSSVEETTIFVFKTTPYRDHSHRHPHLLTPERPQLPLYCGPRGIFAIDRDHRDLPFLVHNLGCFRSSRDNFAQLG